MSRRTPKQVRLATRGSDLALRQAGEVATALEDRRFEVELVEVETTGDQIQDELIHRLGKTGAFVRSLDEKIIDGEVDGAIHSMKDMPTENLSELIVAAIPERASPADALVTPDGQTIDELPEGATVGTASLRRQAQLLHHRPDLTVEPLRGNVDTRIEKLLAPSLQREHEHRTEADKERKGNAGMGDFAPEFERTTDEWFDDISEIERQALGREVEVEYDAIVLAEAGLERSGLDRYVEYRTLSPDEFIPAPGQGAVAVTSLDTDLAEAMHKVLDHPRTRVETTVERTILATLGGGCIAPIGVYALIQGEYVHVEAQVLSQDGQEVIELIRDVPVERHVEGAKQVARDLADRGAEELIQAAKATDADEQGTREEDEAGEEEEKGEGDEQDEDNEANDGE